MNEKVKNTLKLCYQYNIKWFHANKNQNHTGKHVLLYETVRLNR